MCMSYELLSAYVVSHAFSITISSAINGLAVLKTLCCQQIRLAKASSWFQMSS